MSADTSALQAAAIRELCKPLRLPTVAAQAVRLAEQAAKQRQTPLCFLEALLSAEVEEREQNAVVRRIKEAHFPKVKPLEDFDFQSASHLPATLLRQLSEGGHTGRTEPVLFPGAAGTEQTHLAIGLAEAGAERLFQVIAGRAEKAVVIVTMNLPLSEWTTVFPNARLCKAMLDRLTDQAHIIETGSESYRFRRTLDKRRKKNKEGDPEK